MIAFLTYLKWYLIVVLICISLIINAKSWLTGKDPDAGRDWGQEEKGTTEDEMAGWHHRLNGHESEWTPGVGGQGGLACCDSWGRKESDTTERLNWIINDVEHFSCAFWPSICLLWRNVYLDLLPIFWMKFLFFFFFFFELHELFEINLLLVALFVNIFSHSVSCLFILFMVSFAVQKLLSWIRSHLFAFIFIILGCESKKMCCDLCQRIFCFYFPLRVL